MRSTKQFLEEPFKHGRGSRQQRLEELNQQSSYVITPPEIYCDINGMLMDNPCNIGTTSSPCYVDARAQFRYSMHPSLSDSNQKKNAWGEKKDPRQEEWEKHWKDGVYQINQALSRKIEAWLTIEEIRQYTNRLSTTRRRALKLLFPELNYRSRKILFATAANVLKETGRDASLIPTEFTSAATRELMTLPIKLDSGHIIDFSELLTTTDPTTISNERLDSLLEEFRAYCKEDLAAVETQCSHDLVNLDALSEETFNPALKLEMVADASARFQQTKLEHEKAITLEWYVKHFEIPGMKNILAAYQQYLAKEKERITKEMKPCRESLTQLKEHNKIYKVIDGNTIEVIYTDEERQRAIKEYTFNLSNSEKNLGDLETKRTFEWYIKHFCLADAKYDAEYKNPFTKKTVLSVAIETALLKKIDCWIDPLEEQIRVAKAHVAAYSPTLTQKTYAKTLMEKIAGGLLSADKIPETLKIAHIPNETRVEVPTHPILLDGDQVIDYWRLKEYWECKGVIGYVLSFIVPLDWHGYNPFTGKKCKSVEYMHPLKQEIDQFMRLESVARKTTHHFFSLFQPAARTEILEDLLLTSEFKQ